MKQIHTHSNSLTLSHDVHIDIVLNDVTSNISIFEHYKQLYKPVKHIAAVYNRFVLRTIVTTARLHNDTGQCVIIEVFQGERQ